MLNYETVREANYGICNQALKEGVASVHAVPGSTWASLLQVAERRFARSKCCEEGTKTGVPVGASQDCRSEQSKVGRTDHMLGLCHRSVQLTNDKNQLKRGFDSNCNN